MKIMFSAGEVSGDIHGASLARELKRLAPDAELIGFGGKNMQESGVRLIKNFAGFNFMGVVAVVKNLPKILRLLNELTEAIVNERPDVLVIIDYPDFNWRLAKRAKKLGVAVFSYIPPSAWAWRKGRAKTCAGIADKLVTIFPFEAKVYEAAGANVSFLGNPLVDTTVADRSPEETRSFFSVSAKTHIVLLLPGSRRHEIDLLLPTMLAAAREIFVARPDTAFFLPVADNVDEDNIKRKIAEADLPFAVVLTHEARFDLMAAADAAVAASGTVVMEAALLGLPCVVVYKVASITYFILHRFIDIKYFSLPNILLNRPLLTELLQDDVTPSNISAAILKLYRGEQTRESVTAGLKEAAELLGEPHAAARIAAEILRTAREHKHSMEQL